MVEQMAADDRLRRLFENPLPVNPTLPEALSACNHHVHRKKPIDPAFFTKIFDELHFQEKQPDRAVLSQPALAPVLRPPPHTAPWLDIVEADKSKDDSSMHALLRPKPASGTGSMKRSASFSMKKSSASMLRCIEGLGSESTVDADDMIKDGVSAAEAGKEEDKRLPSFPPPIWSIGEGRFMLMQVVISGKELLQASHDNIASLCCRSVCCPLHLYSINEYDT